MPIVRTYGCAECNHIMEVTLRLDQADDPPPECPRCAGWTHQEFKPVAIGGSVRARAEKFTEDIMEKDYHVADYQKRDKYARTGKTRYKDETPGTIKSTWTAATSTLEQAVAAGRETRVRFGSGLDVLQANLKSGAQPDLIAESKKRLTRVF